MGTLPITTLCSARGKHDTREQLEEGLLGVVLRPSFFLLEVEVVNITPRREGQADLALLLPHLRCIWNALMNF